MTQHYFLTAPPFIGDLVADEITALGGHVESTTPLGVGFCGSVPVALRVAIWSRLGNRLLQPLTTAAVHNDDDLYALVAQQDWPALLAADDTLAVRVSGNAPEPLSNGHFVALRCKDAIVDVMRQRTGSRPSIDRQAASLTLDVHLTGRPAGDCSAALSLQVCRTSLHRRGYRPAGFAAPLKENVAAAVLRRSGWPQPMPLCDPMCGSGTLLIEAAMMALDRAPNAQNVAPHWRRSWPEALLALQQEVAERAATGKQRCATPFPLLGYDIDGRAVRLAQQAVQRACLADFVVVQQADVRQLQRPGASPGHLVSNPPYGERLGDASQAEALLGHVGAVVRQHFAGWQVHLLLHDASLGFATRLQASRRHRLRNGPLDATLLHFAVPEPPPVDPARQELKDRLTKNLRQRQREFFAAGIGCFRLYDRDLPQFAVAIDLFEEAGPNAGATWAVVHAFAPPAVIPAARDAARLRTALHVLPEVVAGLPLQNIVLKERHRQRVGDAYDRVDSQQRRIVVAEGPNAFWINLTDYVDCGLFLDQRRVRQWIGELARGRHVLNVFGYTASASVCAARGGAASTLTVDLSPTYLRWAADNFSLARLNGQDHRLVQSDARQFLQACRDTFELIVIDPPTYSNSKRSPEDFDLQADHVALLRDAMRCLSLDGTLIFSHHARRFVLDPQVERTWAVEDRSAAARPLDFRRVGAGSHHCFFIRHRGRHPPRRSPRESA